MPCLNNWPHIHTASPDHPTLPRGTWYWPPEADGALCECRLCWLPAFPFRLPSRSERLAFRDVVSTHSTHNPIQYITQWQEIPHVITTCMLLRQSPAQHTSWHMHMHILHPDTHTLHSAPTIHRAGCCLFGQQSSSGRGSTFFFSSIFVATLLCILARLGPQGSGIVKKVHLGLSPFQPPEGLEPDIVFFQLREGRSAIAGPPLPASDPAWLHPADRPSRAKPNVHSASSAHV